MQYEQLATLRNADGTGRLDLAIKNEDIKAMPQILREVAVMNQEFMVDAARRFAEILAEGPE